MKQHCLGVKKLFEGFCQFCCSQLQQKEGQGADIFCFLFFFFVFFFLFSFTLQTFYTITITDKCYSKSTAVEQH